MSKCRECGLLAWRPGCTAGRGDDFNTYVDFDDDSDCPSFRRAKRKPLVDELAKACHVALIHLSGEATKFSEREPIAVRSRLKKALAHYQEGVNA